MNYGTKLNIINKISLLISKYTIDRKIDKYIIKKEYRDSDGRRYYGILLDKEKVFKHSQFYREYKKPLFSKRGNKKPEFNIAMNQFFESEHGHYITIEQLSLKVMNNEKNFSKEDFEILNTIYRTLL